MKVYAVLLVLGLCVLLVAAKSNGKKKDREGRKGHDRGGRDRDQPAEGEVPGGHRGKPDKGKGGKGDRRGPRPGRPGRPTGPDTPVDGLLVSDPICEALDCDRPTRETRVCGTDGVTYRSECLLIKDRCKGKITEDVEVAAAGACADVELMEPGKGRKPGKGGKRPGGRRGDKGHGKGRWPKECWDVLSTAEPDTVGVEGDVCTAACPVNSSDFPALPVCGTDGSTYASSCVLELAACITENAELSVASEGACQ